MDFSHRGSCCFDRALASSLDSFLPLMPCRLAPADLTRPRFILPLDYYAAITIMVGRKSMKTDIYDRERNPYLTFLSGSNRIQVELSLLRERLGDSSLFQNRGEVKRVIDIGCGFGHMSIALMRMFEESHVAFEYTGIDPVQTQLKGFKELLTREHRRKVKLVASSVEGFVFDEAYDFAFFGHSLYYVHSMHETLKKVIGHSKETCILHHGQGGINTIHQAFSEWVRKGPHIISTYAQVVACLSQLQKEGMAFEYDVCEFQSAIDVKECQNPESSRGRDLITFFLESDYERLSVRARCDVHDFFRNQIGDTMLNDEAIIVIGSREFSS